MSSRRRKELSYNEQNDWARELFVENPALFLPELERLESEAQNEVEGICRIFNSHNLRTGSKVLDFSCGIGRHAIRLAKNGFEVVGYDPSEFFIKKAKDIASEQSDLDPYDMKFYSGPTADVVSVLHNSKRNPFDAILIMFNSFGYATKEDDLQTLKNLKTLASPQALLIMEIENRDWRLKNFLPFVNYNYQESAVVESWDFNLETSVARSISRFYKKSPKNDLELILTLPTHLRLYSLHEFIALLEQATWECQRSYGSIQDLDSLSITSPNIVTVSKKIV